MLLAGCGKPVESTQPEEPAKTALYTAGTYEASALGNNGDIIVSVTFSDDMIEKVEVTKHQETSGIADPALERIPQAIVDNQSLAIDAVSGATMTSKGILEAVEKAVVQANGDVAKLKEKVTANVSHEKIEKTFDVIVVGGGGAGISAASAAAQNGASVVIVEKTAALGGNTIASGFAWNAVDPEIQSQIETKPGQIDMLKSFLDYDEKDFGKYADTLRTLKAQINEYLAGDTSKMFDSEEFHMIQTYLGGKRQDKEGNWIEGDFDLINTLIHRSLDTFKWAKSLGGKFSDVLTSPVGSMWLRGHNPEDKKQIFDALSDFVLKQSDKNEIMLETRAEELLVENGKVVGIKATKVDGTEVVLHANKGVILTTGGYGANAKLAAEYNKYWPSIPLDMKTTNVATATGDGIIMARAVGANLVGMEFIQLMPTANEKI
jgi:fumarate reductase flavoprotein subunit